MRDRKGKIFATNCHQKRLRGRRPGAAPGDKPSLRSVNCAIGTSSSLRSLRALGEGSELCVKLMERAGHSGIDHHLLAIAIAIARTRGPLIDTLPCGG